MVKMKYGKRELIQAVYDSKSNAMIIKSDGKFYVETVTPLLRDFERLVYERNRV